jgi:O-acetyl-ADP-ribose deacetylase (regulator of RNase III)
MELSYVIGDLLEASRNGEVDAIAHSCNCFCTMKSGIAPQIAKEYPAAEEVDKLTKRGDKDKLGTLTYVFRHIRPYLVFNLYTQFRYGKTGVHVNYAALDQSLHLMNEQIILHNSTALRPYDRILKVGMPMISCGLAGGDWGIVSGLIERNINAAVPVVFKLP